MIKTPEEYVESLRDGRVVYQDGERVKDVPTRYRASVERAAGEFWLAHQPETKKLFATEEDGKEIAFSFKIPETGEDIQRRRKITQTLNHWGLGGARLTGIDSLNGVAHACKVLDKSMGTNYTAGMEKYRAWCKDNDPGLCAAVSDPKGNRKLHAEDPGQAHKDFYVRLKEKTNDGIIITGCKLHISDSILSNELIVLPSRNHNETGADYAVACAVSCGTPGVKFIATSGSRNGGHPMIIFDNVFVPWDRVFLAGEWQFSRLFATSFARYHRLTASTYKAVQLQGVAGLGRLMAEMNGLTHATRIRDHLAWLAMYADVTEALAKAAALSPVYDEGTGFAIPNPVYTNAAKYWFANQWHEAMKYLQDITGGIAATMPSMKDFENPEIKADIDKYLQGSTDYSTEDRLKAIMQVINLGSCAQGVLSIHAEGSLSTQRMVIYQSADWDRLKARAKRTLGMPVDHPEFKDLPTEPPWRMPESMVMKG